MTSYLVGKTRRIEDFAESVPGLKDLTAHERAILRRRIARGMSSKEIAEELEIVAKTVDTHRSEICARLRIHGGHVLKRFALRHRDAL